MEQGLLQIYTGDGKGKTTAAIGLAVRALGQGLRVLLVRLLKPAAPASGEIVLLASLPGMEILTSGIGIIEGVPEPAAVAANVQETFEHARRRLAFDDIDLVIFDEINNAVHRGFLPLPELLAFLATRPPRLEIVLTGRHAAPEVLAQADLVTRMENIRHPLAAGVAARRGIEY